MANPVREFAVGAGLLGRGLSLILRRPRLFLLGALPPLITSVLFVGVLVLLLAEVRSLVRVITPFANSWEPDAAGALRLLVGIALVAGAVMLMVISFTSLTLALGSPLYDKISESVEAEFGEVPVLAEPVSRGVRRAVRQALALIGISAPVTLVLFLAGFIPALGQTVVPAASAMFGGWMLTTELVGAPFERRGMLRLADRRRAMRRRRFRVLGFAVPTFLLMAVPFASVVVFPAATAGGTLLARQLLGERTSTPISSPIRRS
jgi:CysZ protein